MYSFDDWTWPSHTYDQGSSRSSQDFDFILSNELSGYTRCVRLGNARSVILHETINGRLCMNPVMATGKNDYVGE